MKKFLTFIVLLLLFSTILSVAWITRYDRPFPIPPGPLFSNETRQDQIDQLELNKPSVVMVGDSTLNTSVDENLLGTLLGREIYSFKNFGSTTAAWYLIIKNSITQAETVPGNLIVCFQDSILTSPGYHVSGDFVFLIDEFATENEPLVIERSYLNQMSWMERIISSYFPLYGDREKIVNRVENIVKRSIPQRVGISTKQVLLDFDEVFQARNKIPMLYREYILRYTKDLYSKQNLNFEKQVTLSYLPEMIRIAREESTHLIFVRLPNQAQITGDMHDLLTTYMNDLEQYFDQEGVGYIDLSQVPCNTAENFSDSIHMNVAGKDCFTPILADELMQHIK